jgi:hypothetical protein
MWVSLSEKVYAGMTEKLLSRNLRTKSRRSAWAEISLAEIRKSNRFEISPARG